MSEANPDANRKHGDLEPGEKKEAKQIREAFACAKEAADLLNCVAAKNYNELKCVTLTKKLRECVKRKGVVSFSLLPDKAPPPPPPDKSTQPKSSPENPSPPP
ncbi:hypothetical protein BSKO_12896 [Bryopsis sp. KO-2023]|nr:hypothetical protein BSKO_12896 [Bryopsis sp. KO-2023]